MSQPLGGAYADELCSWFDRQVVNRCASLRVEALIGAHVYDDVPKMERMEGIEAARSFVNKYYADS